MKVWSREGGEGGSERAGMEDGLVCRFEMKLLYFIREVCDK